MVASAEHINYYHFVGYRDESYAVMNADEKLKEMATGVIGYSEEDGVVKFLMENLSRYL